MGKSSVMSPLLNYHLMVRIKQTARDAPFVWIQV
ncbi:hypothetical protein VC_1569 [Vibrio cholerae O1 biovar El Tor str. N16961]|uniref:Uncharacterized protein n=2 Tax=Vibrio cholerae TaxID=666 RepID=Q9KRR7_VIBCH|nr:hypothetical protein VC_1569 [Vibrio cholerae O1 biovar El Tor str. N16961]ACP05823.1 conserved hypothetical protein [Vibrio cholerae M66-2]